MSEAQTADEAIVEEPPQKTAQEVWDATKPITTEDVAGDKEAPETLPDRALVAPDITNFIQANITKEPSTIETQISEIKGILDAATQPQPEAPSGETAILAKLEALEQRDQERSDKEAHDKAEVEYDAKVRTLREGVVETIRADKEKYPTIVALEQEGQVFTNLVKLLEQGEAVSEHDVASKLETDLLELKDKMNKIGQTETPSKEETPPSKAPQTLTPDLTAADEPFSLEDFSNQKDAAAALWERIHTK
jgi:ribosome-binding protein aMBF1 (putative translation factor)